ncbi:MAG TPA: hypothetical protein VFG87_17520 [Amycolatopsis sp.]|nr:hypothetical protein [Amycolatopsis sp.]
MEWSSGGRLVGEGVEPGLVGGPGDGADACTKPLGLVHEGAQDVERDGSTAGTGMATVLLVNGPEGRARR